jgi:hypothetical protein
VVQAERRAPAHSASVTAQRPHTERRALQGREDTMNRIIIAAALGCAALIGTAHAQDTRTLQQFLRSCSSNYAGCRDNLHDYLEAADSQGMICKPKSMSYNEAVAQSLDWLRQKGDADPTLATGNAEDGEWTAISTLYPCNNNS